jgi:integrase
MVSSVARARTIGEVAMASIHLDKKSKKWHVFFRCRRRQYRKSLGTSDEKKARGWLAQIEETLHDLDRGKLQLPPDANFWEFIKTGGKRAEKPRAYEQLTLKGLFDHYFPSLPEGAKESKTRKVEKIHAAHVTRLLGASRELSSVTGQDLQERYVNRRAAEKHHGRPIKRETIKKELDTLRMVWNRAYRQGVSGVTCPFPAGKLTFPKTKTKEPFRTWNQIEQAVRRGGLTEDDARELWRSVFLDPGRVADVLEHVRKKQSGRRYFYPLLVFAAHTGARLSECIRSRVQDFDFGTGRVNIREKKRDQSAETYRWVDMSQLLKKTIRKWLKDGHPGGSVTFCRLPDKEFHDQTLHDDFEWFMGGTKWEVLPGFHVFRHSFASNMARQGTDQGVIDAFLGHQTEAMRKRYRHFFPEQGQEAIRGLFG